MTSLKSLVGYYASRPKVSLLRPFSLFPGTHPREEMRLSSAPASHPRRMSVVQRTPGLGVASTTPPAVQCLSVTAPAQLAQGRTALADHSRMVDRERRVDRERWIVSNSHLVVSQV
jgi:hypothetical protein